MTPIPLLQKWRLIIFYSNSRSVNRVYSLRPEQKHPGWDLGKYVTTQSVHRYITCGRQFWRVSSSNSFQIPYVKSLQQSYTYTLSSSSRYLSLSLSLFLSLSVCLRVSLNTKIKYFPVLLSINLGMLPPPPLPLLPGMVPPPHHLPPKPYHGPRYMQFCWTPIQICTSRTLNEPCVKIYGILSVYTLRCQLFPKMRH